MLVPEKFSGSVQSTPVPSSTGSPIVPRASWPDPPSPVTTLGRAGDPLLVVTPTIAAPNTNVSWDGNELACGRALGRSCEPTLKSPANVENVAPTTAGGAAAAP